VADLIRTALLLVVAGAWVAGCRHAQQSAPQQPSSTEVAAPPGKPPVGTSPQALFTRDGVLELQRALGRHGFPVMSSGTVDDVTQGALMSFQREKGLPATGMPTVETLRLLGLDGDALYRGRELDQSR
jgi:hypothetical protein